MLISEKQQEANRQNAQHSTGPKTEEGKAAVRLNALTYGLRARNLLITGENPDEYQQLWSDLESDWQPENRTERFFLEQMATSQWLLARLSKGERQVYERPMGVWAQMRLLDRFAQQRARLENAFSKAMHDLERLQQKRQAAQKQPAHTAQAAEAPAPAPVKPEVPHRAHRLPQKSEFHRASCSTVNPDSR